MTDYLGIAKKEQKRLNRIKVNYIYEKMAFSNEFCDKLIKYIDLFKDKGLGKAGITHKPNDEEIMSGKVNAWKNSYDIFLTKELMTEDRSEEFHVMIDGLQQLMFNLVNYYLSYVGVYDKKLIGISYSKWNKQNTKQYSKLIDWESICLRKYDAKVGAYNKVHFDKHLGSTRIVAGIIYLNDIKRGGETVFPQYKKKIKPERGKIVMFPSNFTHLHYSTPPSEDRYNIIFHVSCEPSND